MDKNNYLFLKRIELQIMSYASCQQCEHIVVKIKFCQVQHSSILCKRLLSVVVILLVLFK